ncbi:unnamed protein product [Pleuronectes platessa]|uniref:Uncharacterized protein n=1 Tax=Pleuronectes platessa TaxID=8262 RepID=A0A9N7VPN5_PLEPL|nr:unnamed protein product [Pleuronectes platessa]
MEEAASRSPSPILVRRSTEITRASSGITASSAGDALHFHIFPVTPRQSHELSGPPIAVGQMKMETGSRGQDDTLELQAERRTPLSHRRRITAAHKKGTPLTNMSGEPKLRPRRGRLDLEMIAASIKPKRRRVPLILLDPDGKLSVTQNCSESLRLVDSRMSLM